MKTYIACFGDSLIYGFPFGKAHSWLAKVNLLARGVMLLNYGECGMTCDSILEKMKYTVLPAKVQMIIFLGGTNDLLQNRPLKVILSDVEKALIWATDLHYDFGLVLPWLIAENNINEKVRELRTQLVSRFDTNCHIFDFQPAIGLTQQELTFNYWDGLHPKANTYEKIGEYAKPLIEKWLDDRRNS